MRDTNRRLAELLGYEIDEELTASGSGFGILFITVAHDENDPNAIVAGTFNPDSNLDEMSRVEDELKERGLWDQYEARLMQWAKDRAIEKGSILHRWKYLITVPAKVRAEIAVAVLEMQNED